MLKCIAEIRTCLRIWRSLLSDIDFLGSDFERLIGEMRVLGIVLDEFDEVVLHSAWSGVSTELRDWVHNYRLFIANTA